MKIFDAHCDTLSKLFKNPSINFYDNNSLHVNYLHLRSAAIKVQAFAIYISEQIENNRKFETALLMAKIFFKQIISPLNEIVHVKTKADINNLQENEIGAILTLEGCDCIGTDIDKLRDLLNLGVSAVGLTWNYSNEIASGVLDKDSKFGLTTFGKEVVNLLNDYEISCDVSHLSERAFWDVIEHAKYPFASHSNCFSIANNSRNLTDSQIKALILKDSVIGITFVPEFLTAKSSATLTNILHHIDKICSLGGENNIGFGSDFDGITNTVNGLETMKQYDNLINLLFKKYDADFVHKLLFANMLKMLRN